MDTNEPVKVQIENKAGKSSVKKRNWFITKNMENGKLRSVNLNNMNTWEPYDIKETHLTYTLSYTDIENTAIEENNGKKLM